MTQAELIDECKRRLHLQSDYALAKEWGLAPQHISRYRSGAHRFDDYALHRVAETLDLDPRQLIAERELSRDPPQGKRRTFWETLLRKLRGAAKRGGYTVLCIATSATTGPGNTSAAAERTAAANIDAIPIIRRRPRPA